MRGLEEHTFCGHPRSLTWLFQFRTTRDSRWPARPRAGSARQRKCWRWAVQQTRPPAHMHDHAPACLHACTTPCQHARAHWQHARPKMKGVYSEKELMSPRAMAGPKMKAMRHHEIPIVHAARRRRLRTVDRCNEATNAHSHAHHTHGWPAVLGAVPAAYTVFRTRGGALLRRGKEGGSVARDSNRRWDTSTI